MAGWGRRQCVRGEQREAEDHACADDAEAEPLPALWQGLPGQAQGDGGEDRSDDGPGRTDEQRREPADGHPGEGDGEREGHHPCQTPAETCPAAGRGRGYRCVALESSATVMAHGRR